MVPEELNLSRKNESGVKRSPIGVTSFADYRLPKWGFEEVFICLFLRKFRLPEVNSKKLCFSEAKIKKISHLLLQMLCLYRGSLVSKVFKLYTKKPAPITDAGFFYAIRKTYFLGALYVILYNVPFKSSVT